MKQLIAVCIAVILLAALLYGYIIVSGFREAQVRSRNARTRRTEAAMKERQLIFEFVRSDLRGEDIGNGTVDLDESTARRLFPRNAQVAQAFSPDGAAGGHRAFLIKTRAGIALRYDIDGPMVGQLSAELQKLADLSKQERLDQINRLIDQGELVWWKENSN